MKHIFLSKVFIPIILFMMLICNIASGASIINTLNTRFYNVLEGHIYVPLSIKQIEYIIDIPKGQRPNPSTYLSNIYIQNHLLKFKNGVTIVIGADTYFKYVEKYELIGREDNTCFVMPTYICDQIESMSNGDISIYEKMLSFNEGYFTNQHGLIRLDIEDIQDLNIRIPSGNELGANEYWIPGGYTMGGIPEAVTNLIPKFKTKIKFCRLL